jgi:hypothetical protein
VLSTSSNCSSPCQSVTMNSTGTCSAFAASSCGTGTAFYALGVTAPTGAACGMPVSSAVLPEPTWSLEATACGLPMTPSPDGCVTGRLCVPQSRSPICIMAAGDVACPQGSSYANRHVYYGGLNEGRSCSVCTCATVGTGTCTGQLNLFSADGCSGSTQNLQVTFGACTSILPATRSVDLNYLTLTEPPCAASGGIAQGTATATAPTTLCCL